MTIPEYKARELIGPLDKYKYSIGGRAIHNDTVKLSKSLKIIFIEIGNARFEFYCPLLKFIFRRGYWSEVAAKIDALNAQKQKDAFQDALNLVNNK